VSICMSQNSVQWILEIFDVVVLKSWQSPGAAISFDIGTRSVSCRRHSLAIPEQQVCHNMPSGVQRSSTDLAGQRADVISLRPSPPLSVLNNPRVGWGSARTPWLPSGAQNG